MAHTPIKKTAVLVGLLAGLTLVACDTTPTRVQSPNSGNTSTSDSSGSRAVDELLPLVRGMKGAENLSEMRAKSFLLADYVCGTVGEAVAALVAQPETTTEQRVWLLQLRLDVGRSMISTASSPDPITDIFQQLFLIRVGLNIVEREAPEKIGPRGQSLIDVFKRLDEAAWGGVSEAIGQSLDPLKMDVEEWLTKNPHASRFWWAREMGLMRAMGSKALVHYSGMFAAVNRANEGIARLNLTLDRISFVAERMPMLVSWEIQAAAAVLLATSDVQKFVEGPGKLGDSISALDASIAKRFALVGNNLQLVREQLVVTGNQIGSAGTTISGSMEETRDVLSSAASELQNSLHAQGVQISGALEQSAGDIDKGTESMSKSLDDLSKTINDETQKVLAQVELMKAELKADGADALNAAAWRVGVGAGILVVIAVVLSMITALGISRASKTQQQSQ